MDVEISRTVGGISIERLNRRGKVLSCLMAGMAFWKSVGRLFSYVEHGKGRSSGPHASPGLAFGAEVEVGAEVVDRPLVLVLLLFFLKGSFQRPLPSECSSFYHH